MSLKFLETSSIGFCFGILYLENDDPLPEFKIGHKISYSS